MIILEPRLTSAARLKVCFSWKHLHSTCKGCMTQPSAPVPEPSGMHGGKLLIILGFFTKQLWHLVFVFSIVFFMMQIIYPSLHIILSKFCVGENML